MKTFCQAGDGTGFIDLHAKKIQNVKRSRQSKSTVGTMITVKPRVHIDGAVQLFVEVARGNPAAADQTRVLQPVGAQNQGDTDDQSGKAADYQEAE